MFVRTRRQAVALAAIIAAAAPLSLGARSDITPPKLKI